MTPTKSVTYYQLFHQCFCHRLAAAKASSISCEPKDCLAAIDQMGVSVRSRMQLSESAGEKAEEEAVLHSAHGDPSLRVHSSGEIPPASFDLHVHFIHAPGGVGRFHMQLAALLELGASCCALRHLVL